MKSGMILDFAMSYVLIIAITCLKSETTILSLKSVSKDSYVDSFMWILFLV